MRKNLDDLHYKNLKNEVRVYSNMGCILDKIHQDGILKDLRITLDKILG